MIKKLLYHAPLYYIVLMLNLTRGGAHINIMGIYISEILLISTVIIYFYQKLKRYKRNISVIRKNSIEISVCLLYVYGILLVFNSYIYSENIVIIARNSAFFWYCPLMICGYMASKYYTPEITKKWIVHTLIIAIILLIYHPFRENFADGEDSIFGWYSSFYIVLLTSSFVILISSINFFYSSISMITVAATLLYLQSRSSFIIIICFIIMIFIFYKNQVSYKKELLWISIISIPVIIVIVDLLGNSRTNILNGGIKKLISSMIPGLINDNISLTGGVDDRIQWWKSSLSLINFQHQLDNLLFGIGLDQILIDTGVGHFFIIRFPHNSYITILVLYGIVGLLLSAFVFINYFKIILFILKKTKVNIINNFAFFYGVAMMIASLSGVVLETPYYAAPFWILYGVVYKLYSQYSSSKHDTLD